MRIKVDVRVGTVSAVFNRLSDILMADTAKKLEFTMEQDKT
jgi:hypothetical protein